MSVPEQPVESRSSDEAREIALRQHDALVRQLGIVIGAA